MAQLTVITYYKWNEQTPITKGVFHEIIQKKHGQLGHNWWVPPKGRSVGEAEDVRLVLRSRERITGLLGESAGNHGFLPFIIGVST